MDEYQNQESTENFGDEDKTIAILSYITIVGWLAAYIMSVNKKTTFNLFHIRQGLGVNLLVIAVWVITKVFVFVPFIGWYFNVILTLLLFIIWVMSFVGAINGEAKPVILVGEPFQKMFEAIK